MNESETVELGLDSTLLLMNSGGCVVVVEVSVPVYCISVVVVIAIEAELAVFVATVNGRLVPETASSSLSSSQGG